MPTIAKFQKYINLLDEVYKQASLTANLDISGELVRAGANANEIVIPKFTAMDGLADYSRSAGYVGGDVTLSNETVQFNYDRGRSFIIDAMDDEETAGVAFGKLVTEFMRTKVIPELDAFRFATYAGTSSIGTTTADDLATGGDALAALVAALNTMQEAEVPTDQLYCYMTPTIHNLIDAVDSYKSKMVLDRFAGIIDVPQTRFYTAIDLLDGTTVGETAGGYAKASGAKNINFMLIHKPAVIQYGKHTVNKIVSPEENQIMDAWKFMYRAYGLADVYDNKVAGIYLHKAES